MLRARFKEALWFEKARNTEVIVGGAGGIGSWLIFLLARLDVKLYVYDFDSVERHNIGNQLYNTKSIDKSKVDALESICHQFSNVYFDAKYIEKYDEDSISSPIMFSAFDNMEARKIMFNNWKSNESRELFIDGRMEMENYQIYIVQKGQEERYEKSLFEDSEVPDLPCGAKATSHTAADISSNMVKCFTNYLTNTEVEIRNVPFKITSVAALMNYDIEF